MLRTITAGALAIATVLASGCLADSSGAMVFPARYDVAPVGMSQGSHRLIGVHAAGALSWASVSPNPENPVDLSIGYQVESYRDPEAGRDDGGAVLRDTAGATSATEPAPAPTGDGADDGLMLQGPFLEFGTRLAGTEHRRLWLSARGELLFQRAGGETLAGVGGVVRASAELFAAGKGQGFIGAAAVGPFIELGARRLPAGPLALLAIAGLSVRLPLIAVN